MTTTIDICVPDIGDFSDVPVIELFAKVGDTIKVDDPICALESDKATMEVPATAAGIIREILINLGDTVSKGTLLLKLESSAESTDSATPPKAAPEDLAAPAPPPASAAPQPEAPANAPTLLTPSTPSIGTSFHASPSVRAYARELGVDLARIRASGSKNRITKDDVTGHIKEVMQTSSASTASVTAGTALGGIDLLPWPKVDFAKFGTIEVKPLSRIKKISGQNLSRNWVMIPHVTNFDEADITDLEAFRIQLNKENEKSGGVKLTMLAFLVKACVKALQKYPEFNASLDGENLVLKQYFHMGFAADTPNGLVVPVVRDADKKGIFQIAEETGALAKKARDGKLAPTDMQGGCFSVSSLGGIGGSGFTPIINAPEVAILGVTKARQQAIWDGKQFVPRLILPLCLSWDHRVIDGAAAARFLVYLANLLADFRRIAL